MLTTRMPSHPRPMTRRAGFRRISKTEAQRKAKKRKGQQGEGVQSPHVLPVPEGALTRNPQHREVRDVS